MSYKLNTIGETGLHFFGKMSATNCHDIKNALAIINENIGLLQDFILMSEKGMAIDPERLKTLAEKVVKQVWRADGFVKNMSRFAHSVDEPVVNVDLNEILELVKMLSSRFVSMRGVILKPEPSTNPVMVTTNPFLLENLVWLCLDFAMEVAGSGKTVGLITEETKDGARIRFTHLEGLKDATADSFPTEQANALLEALKGKLTPDAGIGELVLTLPGAINS
ncbi:MAG: HAMP domain-containing histidine kinase [Deltaproteobacteria bacterium]|nr:HAMP domain-containing histidine kinase [Deltaproteobacteria bacterium]